MTAKLSFEIELELEGTVAPYHAATRDDPEEGGFVEDMEIMDVGIVTRVPAPLAERGSHPRGIWKTTSLLDGVDRQSPDIQKLFANILAMMAEDAAEAIMEDAA